VPRPKPVLLDWLASVAVLAISLRPLLALHWALGMAGAALFLAGALWQSRGGIAARALVLFGGAHLTLGPVMDEAFSWPWHLLLPLLATVTALALRRESKLERIGIMRGSLALREWGAIVAIALVAGFALWLWTEIFRPDLSEFRAMMPTGGTAVLIGAALVFALLNAAMEELVWRGAIQHWLSLHVGSVLAVILQAVSFGLIHWAGFPSGWTGVALAAIYGVMLGALRALSGGLLAPFVAHIFADLVIFGLILSAT